MSSNNLIKDYLTFPKKETLAALLFIGIVVSLILYSKVSQNKSKQIAIKEDTLIAKAIDKVQSREQDREDFDDDRVSNYQFEPTNDNTSFLQGQLFQFDPNTLDIAGWKRLGLRDKTIKTIANYRNKGGKFYKKEDLKKIWGMPAGFYERVEEYINITSVQKKSFDNYSPNYSNNNFKREERRITNVNINQSDTSSFIALPGIGSKLAARITNFRDKLGGFYSVDQVKETYGLPDSTFQKIKPYLQVDAGNIKKFNINTATKDELKVHPYIKWNLANAIVEYRNQHGPFKSITDLKKIILIDEATFNKLAPYFTL